MTPAPSRVDLLELDIDTQLALLWQEAGQVQKWDLVVAAAFMRAAYGKGYLDSLSEPVPGALCKRHGYSIPERQAV